MAPSHMKLYEIAFIHKSASLTLSDGTVVNNERMEYLGDAILNAVIANYLFRNYPDEDEGFLTKMRSKMVRRRHLNLLAMRLGIDKLMTFQKNPGHISRQLYGNAFEALIGAIYLDKGFKKTGKFVERIIKRYVNLEKLIKSDTDYKSQLIEWVQKRKKEIVFESHERQKGSGNIFVTSVKVSENEIGRGTGSSKKDSEQKAAKLALERLSRA